MVRFISGCASEGISVLNGMNDGRIWSRSRDDSTPREEAVCNVSETVMLMICPPRR
jgi:hypothetical protein